MTKIVKTILFLTFFTGYSVPGQQTIFWKIEDTLNHKTSYLLGTAHQMGASFIESFPEIDQAMKECSVSIFESVGATDYSLLSTRQSHAEIPKILTKKEYLQLQAFTKTRKWAPFLNQLEPQEIEFLLYKAVSERVCDTYSSSDSLIQLDDYLELKAQKLNKKIIGLETTASQIDAIRKSSNKPTWESRKKNLKALLKILKIGKVNKSLCEVLTQYKNLKFSYDLELNCPQDPLGVERNEEWLKILPNYLKKESCFISVGIAHLVQKCGLIMKLKEYGYVVTPIEIKK